MATETLLTNVRVLDLTDIRGFICGRILADLGADVVKIEKPGGDADRMIGPFIDDVPANDRGLLWLSFNCNKRGITIDIEKSEGKELFKKLVKKADIIIESYHPGYLDKLGLGYSALSKLNPRCIMVSISPFGQTGPYSDYKGADLVCTAMSGWLYLCGDSDRAPVRISAPPQAYFNAGVEAAMAAMFAFWSRETTGEGQHIDVSAQQSIIVDSFQAVPYWELNQTLLKRVGPFRTGLTAGVKQRQTWHCKGGFVNFSIIGGKAGSKTNANLIKWMNSEGVFVEGLSNADWDNFDMGKITQGQLGHLESAFARFFLTHTKEELYEGALQRGIMLCPVSNVKDILDSTQLQAREFWNSVEYPASKVPLKYPGKFIDVTGIDVGIRLSAPLPGQHNDDIYVKELGLSRKKMDSLMKSGAI